MRTRKIVALVALLVAAALAPSCGARTGLRDPPAEAGVPIADAGGEEDAASDVAPDVGPDAPEDAKPDIQIDGLAPCDPEDLFVYLVTSQTALYRYDPATGEVKKVGTLDCGTAYGTPFSMGVSRSGYAFVVYLPYVAPGVLPAGHLFAVDITNAKCTLTDYVPGQHNFNMFGMGFAIDDDGLGETLYVAAADDVGIPSEGLGHIDLANYELTPVGPFSDNPGYRVELTSSDDGKLYGYFMDPQGGGGTIVQIDKQTAAVTTISHITAGGANDAFAFAYWAGDFYVFTASLGGPSTVTRYRPSDGSVKAIGKIPNTVVGAGVSTCNAK